MDKISLQKPLVVILGPTASGKTSLGIELAECYNGEIVGADSRQIYLEMDIATAKPTNEEQARVPHHLIDLISPDQSFTLANFQSTATAFIDDIHRRGKIPFLVGGTGLYIRAIVDGLAIPSVSPNPELRQQWEELAAKEGHDALHALLAQHDPLAATNIPPSNVRRIIRALEVCVLTGQSFSAQQISQRPPYSIVILGLNTERAQLYAWADIRIDAMLASGLVEEVERLVAHGYSWDLPAMSGLGYRQIGAYLRSEMSLADAITRLKYDTHGFIRKQLIWFRPDTRIKWLDAAVPNRLDLAIESLQNCQTEADIL
jgi:tRNA dimethylallyltransferase